ncbi:MAG: hypothetical protein KatS3mg061_2078 [Dehalococcoidia bacterium]|nr:MAG: hypothetical protein KatS3mg061_2078 [Dehalococcoidia bacterium]
MADYQDRFVTANGLRFHYLEWGSAASAASCLASRHHLDRTLLGPGLGTARPALPRPGPRRP